MAYIGIDVGTTGSKATVIEKNGAIITSIYHEYDLRFPAPGYVEMRPGDVWDAVFRALKMCIRDSVYGNDETLNLPIEQKSSCRIDLLSDYDGDGKVGWLDGAKCVHARMPKLRTDFYDDKFIYVAGGDHPRLPKPKNTFDELLGYVKGIAHMTDGNPQIAFVIGWQINGMDTGYPDTWHINERMGGYEAYLNMLWEAEKIGCSVGLHDNFDDAYSGSCAFDEKQIARLPDGSLWKSRSWTRDASYVQGLAKYIERGPGLQRIDETIRRYHIREIAHSDVLSWFGIRHDWDKEYPASGIRNLYRGRYRILEEYAIRGVDMSSEALRYPMVGRMNVNFVENDFFGDCPFDGESIPLLSLIYRNAAMYGGDEMRGPGDWGLRLIHNIRKVMWFPWTKKNVDEIRELTQFFYELYVPWFLLHRLEVVDYERCGTVQRMTLEDGCKIEADEATEAYCVVWHGKIIAQNECVTCPLNEEKIAFFANEDTALSYPLEEEWLDEPLFARELDYDGTTKEWPYTVRDGMLNVTVRPGLPVIVSRKPIEA